MPIHVDKVPQQERPIVLVTLEQVIRALPDTIPYAKNFWIGEKIVRFGQTADNLVFFVDQAEEPTPEMRQYFDGLLAPLGKDATVLNAFRESKFLMMRIYNEGRLIVNKDTLSFTELPSKTALKPVLTSQEVFAKLPETIEWPYAIYLTGGLVRNGWSSNDGDIIIYDERARNDLAAIRKFFTNIMGWRFDVGFRVMEDREPVYLYKIYDEGKLWRPI